MIIYLCGGEHCGKTTLSNFIRDNYYGYNYLHGTYSSNWKSLRDYHLNMVMFTSKMQNEYNQSFVVDRCCLDSIPYKFLNEKNGNTYDDAIELFNQWRNAVGSENFKLIYCKPSEDEWNSEREEMFEESDNKLIKENFDNLMKNIKDYYIYDYKTDGKDMKKFLENILK